MLMHRLSNVLNGVLIRGLGIVTYLSGCGWIQKSFILQTDEIHYWI